MDAGSPPVGRRGVAPFRGDLVLLGRGEEGKIGEVIVRVAGDGRHQGLQVARHAPHARGVEQVGVVLERAGDALRRLFQAQGEVEERFAGLDGQVLQAQVGRAPSFGRQVLIGEENLENGRAGQVTVRLQLLDQPLERQVRMGEGAQNHLPHPRQQLAESGMARQIAAQHQRVDKKADQALRLHPIAVGDRRAERHVLAATVTVQQDREGRQQHHERRCLFNLPQVLKASRRAGGQDHGLAGAVESLALGSRTIGGELQ